MYTYILKTANTLHQQYLNLIYDIIHGCALSSANIFRYFTVFVAPYNNYEIQCLVMVIFTISL